MGCKSVWSAPRNVEFERCSSGRRKKKKGAFNDNKHSDNCVVLNELHFLVHLPHGIPAVLPRANKTAHSTFAGPDAIITFSLCIMWQMAEIKWKWKNTKELFFFCFLNGGICARCCNQIIAVYLAWWSSSLEGYDKTEGGYISLYASNGSLRADSQDLICVYLQPGSQKKGTFLRVWS